MTWFLMALRKYAVFSGRSRRKEYWMFILFTVVVMIGLAIIDILVGTWNDAAGVGVLSGLFYLAILAPYFAVTARRLQDTGRSGWLQLLFLIPILGLILWLIWLAKNGDYGENKYGPDPKTAALYPQSGTAPA